MFEKINEFKNLFVQKAIEQVIWAESNLRGKTGSEKKAAVVAKLDALITLPFYLEWADDLVLSWIVDAVCEKLNTLTGHKFANIALSDAQENEITDAITISEDLIRIKGAMKNDDNARH